MRRISVCLTTFNRYDLVLDCYQQILGDERVAEIIIVDDCSTDGSYEKLKSLIDAVNPVYKKLSLVKNDFNLDCYFNKRRAIDLASCEWCIIFDSDNTLTKNYIDKLFAIDDWDEKTIYQPSFAKPHFNFKAFEGMTITKENVAENMDKPMFSTLLNAQNYFVNRNTYSDVWKGNIDPHTADSLFHNFNHLAAGGKIFVVPGLEYDHLVHDNSHYKLNNHKTGTFYSEIENKLRQLK